MDKDKNIMEQLEAAKEKVERLEEAQRKQRRVIECMELFWSEGKGDESLMGFDTELASAANQLEAFDEYPASKDMSIDQRIEMQKVVALRQLVDGINRIAFELRMTRLDGEIMEMVEED